MKLDERDIVCEQDYTPLSNAELVATIERYAAIMHAAPLVDFDLEWITGPARALLARAEAAKRERDSANIEAALEQSNAREAWARVAELEAALTGDIQAVTADGRQHRIRRGDWRPYPASLYEAEATE